MGTCSSVNRDPATDIEHAGDAVPIPLTQPENSRYDYVDYTAVLSLLPVHRTAILEASRIPVHTGGVVTSVSEIKGLERTGADTRVATEAERDRVCQCALYSVTSSFSLSLPLSLSFLISRSASVPCTV
eukprot:g233.t1